MPFENLLQQSRQAREKSKRFQEEAFQQRHNIAKRDSEKTAATRREQDLIIDSAEKPSEF